MNLIDLIIAGKLDEAKQCCCDRLKEITAKRLEEAKRYQGRITKVRRRIRRNAKGRIVVQKNRRRSGIKGYRISGNTVKRIPATERLRKARLLKRSWKTTRRAKLRRTMLKRKMSMRRRASMGLR